MNFVKSVNVLVSRKNVGFSALHIISRTETRNYVGEFSVHFLESDKMLGYWLPFYLNRIERTHFVILAELSKKNNIFDTYRSRFNAIQSRIHSSELALAVKAHECENSIHFLITFLANSQALI